jgi:hypothetical protein
MAQDVELRYRRPYTARHSSVSWNLMAGRNRLWVAKQHGHSICTMLRVYAASADGALESEVQAIKRSMNPHARRCSRTKRSFSVAHRLPCRKPTHPLVCLHRTWQSPANATLAVDLPVHIAAKMQVPKFKGIYLAERRILTACYVADFSDFISFTEY